ncbi:hypothetical protein F8E02_12425 [Methanoculleus sp. Wushi-C6]|uniref:Uncharacterized protein n=1 Tax=Methanoculleus caldifontis TaxID=2651577 RepID=A0ABU3X420_9EURY|nr:hypothetical protein [Methanoculleus sp. Wushi-C6]MDV2482783.1 hypothetical protein [Methanoculleus sp. Wushi-C6]
MPDRRDHILFHEYFHGDDGTIARLIRGYAHLVQEMILTPPARPLSYRKNGTPQKAPEGPPPIPGEVCRDLIPAII